MHDTGHWCKREKLECPSEPHHKYRILHLDLIMLTGILGNDGTTFVFMKYVYKNGLHY